MTFDQSLSNRLTLLVGAPAADVFLAWLLLSDQLDSASRGTFTARFDPPNGRLAILALAVSITVLWLCRAARLLRGRADLILNDHGIDAAGAIRARRIAWEEVAMVGRPVPWGGGMHQIRIQSRAGRTIRLLTAYEHVTASELYEVLVRFWRTATP